MPPKRLARHTALACGIAVLAAIACAAAAPAATLTRAQADIARQIAAAGPYDGAFAYDLSTGRRLLSVRASVPRPPASVEKLYTSATLLALLGPQARLSTQVLGSGSLAAGVWQGTLYLRGGGDPTLGDSAFIRGVYGGVGASVQALARSLSARGIRRITGGIRGDESYLDPLRGEPSSGYAPDPFLEGTLSGLAFDRGATGSARGAHAPAAWAASRLAAALRALGVQVQGTTAAAVTPAAAAPLAAVSSPTLAQLLSLMLPPSDNYFAETLIKDLGARFGAGGSTAAGAAVVLRTVASRFGVHPTRILDGSGLSEADRTTPAQVGALLIALAHDPLGAVLRGAMAVAGRSGTLALRMRGTSAAGRCRAKTGTLTGVSNLAGYCTSANGHLVAFAVFNDGISVEAAHRVQDRIAADLAGATIAPAEEGLPAPAPAGGSGETTPGGAPAASGAPVSGGAFASGGAQAASRR